VSRVRLLPVVDVFVEGTGEATQLGKSRSPSRHGAYPDQTAIGTYHLVAAKRRHADRDVSGQATPIAGLLPLHRGNGDHHRRHGPVRRRHRKLTIERLYDTATDTTVGSFDGTISTPRP